MSAIALFIHGFFGRCTQPAMLSCAPHVPPHACFRNHGRIVARVCVVAYCRAWSHCPVPRSLRGLAPLAHPVGAGRSGSRSSSPRGPASTSALSAPRLPMKPARPMPSCAMTIAYRGGTPPIFTSNIEERAALADRRARREAPRVPFRCDRTVGRRPRSGHGMHGRPHAGCSVSSDPRTTQAARRPRRAAGQFSFRSPDLKLSPERC